MSIYSFLTSCILCGFDLNRLDRWIAVGSKNYANQCPAWVFQFASDRICGTQPFANRLPSLRCLRSKYEISCVSDIYTKTLNFSLFGVSSLHLSVNKNLRMQICSSQCGYVVMWLWLFIYKLRRSREVTTGSRRLVFLCSFSFPKN